MVDAMSFQTTSPPASANLLLSRPLPRLRNHCFSLRATFTRGIQLRSATRFEQPPVRQPPKRAWVWLISKLLLFACLARRLAFAARIAFTLTSYLLLLWTRVWTFAFSCIKAVVLAQCRLALLLLFVAGWVVGAVAVLACAGFVVLGAMYVAYVLHQTGRTRSLFTPRSNLGQGSISSSLGSIARPRPPGRDRAGYQHLTTLLRLVDAISFIAAHYNTSNSSLPILPSTQPSNGWTDLTTLEASSAHSPKKCLLTALLLTPPRSHTSASSSISSPRTSVPCFPSSQFPDEHCFTNEENDDDDDDDDDDDEPFADALPFQPVNGQDEDDDEFTYPVSDDAVIEHPVERVTSPTPAVSTTPPGSPPPGCKLPKLPPLSQLDVVMSRIKGELAAPKLSSVPVATIPTTSEAVPVPPVRLPAKGSHRIAPAAIALLSNHLNPSRAAPPASKAHTTRLALHATPRPPPSRVVDSFDDPPAAPSCTMSSYNPHSSPRLIPKDNVPLPDHYLNGVEEPAVTLASFTPVPHAVFGSSLQPSPVIGACYPFAWTAPTAPTSVQTFTPSPPAVSALPSCQATAPWPVFPSKALVDLETKDGNSMTEDSEVTVHEQKNNFLASLHAFQSPIDPTPQPQTRPHPLLFSVVPSHLHPQRTPSPVLASPPLPPSTPSCPPLTRYTPPSAAPSPSPQDDFPPFPSIHRAKCSPASYSPAPPLPPPLVYSNPPFYTPAER
ncbi:hypothetical protein JCM5296_005278 [Sporobolomyces johnsonii]